MRVKAQLDVSTKPMAERALYLATKHHAGIKRKYTGEPYINHPVRVAEILLLFGFHTEEVLSAALMHDCLEDENADGEMLEARFVREITNDRVLRWVQLLSNTETGNRKERKAKAALRIMNAPIAVQAIKLADIIDNCKGIAAHDPGFASVYLDEKWNMVNMIRRENSISDMIDTAKETISEEMEAVALHMVATGKETQAKEVKREEVIDQIIAEEQHSIYAEFSMF